MQTIIIGSCVKVGTLLVSDNEKEPEEEFDLLKYKYKSSERQRVFAGRKKCSGKPGVVDSLFIQAQRMVIANLDCE